ncbi:MAG TPA: tripartite tricarboxylate transporter TctB family protein [Usitatibacter sp.]|nr:tripartite tricarboxylate transporter TctB family protein [Usitatibacter sp.]
MQPDKAVGSNRAWEAIVAITFLVFGAIVVWDSHRLGSSWGDDGPQAGYFPFYIGVFILVASTINLVQAFRSGAKGREAFVEWGQLKMILTVMVPSVVYVAAIDNPWYSLGFYSTSVVFIAFYMRLLGKYGWIKTILVSVGTIVAFFVMFEIWFSVPLPKGPLEAAFGYA